MFKRARLTNVIAGMLVAGVATLTFSGTAAAATWRYFETDGDWYWDAAAMDAGGNGCFEDIYFDLDNDGPWDTNLYNSGGSDCFLEVITYDLNENGRVEAWARDTNGIEGFEWLYVDANENGYYEQTIYVGATSYTTVVGGAPTYGGMAGLVLTMANITRSVAW